MVDLPDLELLSVRFPGRYVPSAVQQLEDNGEPWYGVYVALVDQRGVIRALQHSAGGASGALRQSWRELVMSDMSEDGEGFEQLQRPYGFAY
jgi:hypothetical protein